MSNTTKPKDQTTKSAHIGDITIADFWYRASCDLDYSSPKCIYKFMAEWLSFNFLYNLYSKVNSEGEFSNERKAIRRYCDLKKDVILRAQVFRKFSNEVLSLTEFPIYSLNHTISGKSVPCTKEREKQNWAVINQKNATDIKKDELARFQALIQIIYTVRCNLFHGAKNPDVDRDYILVCASAKIMGLLVKELLDSERNWIR